MNQIRQDRPATRVVPALLHIEAGQEITSTLAGKRRIAVLLDHPAAKQLAAFSWALVIMVMIARQRVTAFVAAIVIVIGLIIGVINALRWLFRKA
jgi:hypothetical protein